MHLSQRMQMVADMLSPCECLADIGCDHGYLSIYLVKEQVAGRAIAMDLREGPLARAKENIACFGLDGQIETRLSDGVKKLAPGEAEALVLAGMGGRLMMEILEAGSACRDAAKQLVLQPQSEIPEVRAYLVSKGFAIIKEDMCLEDGKFYVVMKAVHGGEEKLSPEEALGGPCLIRGKHPVAAAYVAQLVEKKKRILEQLEGSSKEEALRRREEAAGELAVAKRTLQLFA